MYFSSRLRAPIFLNALKINQSHWKSLISIDYRSVSTGTSPWLHQKNIPAKHFCETCPFGYCFWKYWPILWHHGKLRQKYFAGMFSSPLLRAPIFLDALKINQSYRKSLISIDYRPFSIGPSPWLHPKKHPCETFLRDLSVWLLFLEVLTHTLAPWKVAAKIFRRDVFFIAFASSHIWMGLFGNPREPTIIKILAPYAPIRTHTPTIRTASSN